MKKIISVVLVLVLILSFSVNAFAANPIITDGGSDSVEFKGTFVPAPPPEVMLCVDFRWDSLEFTYTGAKEGDWNPATLQYDNAEPAKWEVGTDVYGYALDRVMVSNCSNALMDVSASYAPMKGYENISAVFTIEGDPENHISFTKRLGSKAFVTEGLNSDMTVHIKPQGDLPEGELTKAPIGTVTVTIATVKSN